MIIYFPAPFTGQDKSYEAHKDYDVPNADAIRYIETGVARKSPEPVTERPEAKPPAAPATLKPGEAVLPATPPNVEKKPAAKPVDAPKSPPAVVSAVEPDASKKDAANAKR